MKTKIKATKNMYNHGLCFTKDHIYTVNKKITMEASLMDCQVINNLGEPHLISSWWRNFRIINK